MLWNEFQMVKLISNWLLTRLIFSSFNFIGWIWKFWNPFKIFIIIEKRKCTSEKSVTYLPCKTYFRFTIHTHNNIHAGSLRFLLTCPRMSVKQTWVKSCHYSINLREEIILGRVICCGQVPPICHTTWLGGHYPTTLGWGASDVLPYTRVGNNKHVAIKYTSSHVPGVDRGYVWFGLKFQVRNSSKLGVIVTRTPCFVIASKYLIHLICLPRLSPTSATILFIYVYLLSFSPYKS